MPEATADFARSIVEAYADLEGFEATQTIRAGAIHVAARVRFRRPDLCTVEFQDYSSPLVELEERLANRAEFTGEELVGMSLFFDGKATTAFDPSTAIALERSARSVYEPLPGFRAICELGYLETLTRDFLVRDAGNEAIEGRPARLLGIKPKQSYRSQLLRAVTFPLQRATVAFDEETKFPKRLRFFPSQGTLLATFLGARDPITIEYTNVRLETPASTSFSFSPPEGSRVFREEFVDGAELADRIPFGCSFDSLERRGYRLLDEGGPVAVDEENSRAYFTLRWGLDEAGAESRILTLRAGTFLSRNMSRRRATIAEAGKAVVFGDIEGHLLDRGRLWAEQIPDESPRKAFEASWTHDEVFWLLAGDGVEEEELVDLASALAMQAPAPQGTDSSN